MSANVFVVIVGMEMLSCTNIPVVTEDVKTEMVTPTGMTVVKRLGITF